MATSLESDKELKSELFFATKCTHDKKKQEVIWKGHEFNFFFDKMKTSCKTAKAKAFIDISSLLTNQ